MTPNPIDDPPSAGNNGAVGSVADIDDAQMLEDLDGDLDMTDRGVNPGDSGGAANDGGDSQDGAQPNLTNKPPTG